MAWNILFYEKPNRKPIEKFLAALPKLAKAKCLNYLQRFNELGFSLPGNYLEKVDDNLWALRPEASGNEYRLFFCKMAEKDTIVVVHAIYKNQRRIASNDLEIAKNRRDELTKKKK